MRARRFPNGRLRLRNGRIVLAIASLAGSGPGNPATAITVVSLLNQTVFQRINGSKAVPVGFTVTGPAGTSVEARVVDETGAAIGSGTWSPVGVSGEDGRGAGTLTVPQGGWYKLQVRVAGSQTLVATDTNKFGVGAVIGLIGQSNMVNFVTSGDTYPVGHPKAIYFSASSTYLRIGNTSTTREPNYPTSTGNMVSGSVRGGGPVYLANMLAIELGVPVMLVDRPVGGSTIASWTDGTVNNNWDLFRRKLDLAGGDMEAAFLHQGESNAATATEAYMRERWGIVQAQCLAQTGRTTGTFKLGMISIGPGKYLGSTEGEFGAMRVWQRDYSTTTPGWFYAAASHAAGAGGDTPETAGDHVHAGGHANRGRYMARSYLALMGFGASGAGPYITGATRSGLVVTLAVAHSGGTALTDGLGGSGSALTGFRFFDAGAGGAQIAYSATAIVGNTIQITLASAPVGALTVDYAITDVPHGSYAAKGMYYYPASCVFDNVAMPNMTHGCPMQPLAAITVTGG